MGKKSLIGFCFLFATLCALPSAPQHVIGEYVVEDPYYWLEEDSKDTEKWLDGQRGVFEETIVADGRREELFARLEQMTDLPEYAFPIESEGRFFYSGRGSIWCEDRQLVDMEAWPESWTMAGMVVRGGTLIYGVTEHGSDWERWFVVDVESGEQLGDELRDILHYRPVLSSDGDKMYYWRANGEVYDLYCHRKGTAQSQDQLLEGVNGGGPIHPVGAGESLLLCTGGWTLFDIETGRQRPIPVGEQSLFVGERADALLFVTREGRHALVSVTYDGKLATVIPQSDGVIDEVAIAGRHLAVVHERQAVQSLTLYDLQGRFEREVELPGKGTVSRHWRNFVLSGCPESSSLYFHYQDLATPPTLYRCDVETGLIEPVFGEMPPRDDIVTQQVLVKADDGEEVPVTIYHRADLDPMEAHPALLYGYGGFSLPMTPVWSPMQLVWIEEGGIYAVANIRGGGEKGEEWHDVALGAKRQRAFDDFIQVGEWLKGSGLASHVALYGRSNGGLLTAVCGLQRPDLFDAVISSVGVHDMVRFPDFTSGPHWIGEFGDPSSLEDLPHLLRFSPYHNVVPGQYYPPMLITTGAHDDRVVPSHSYKFAAMLLSRGDGQALLRVDPTGSHQPNTQESENQEHADMLTFLFQSMQSNTVADRSQ